MKYKQHPAKVTAVGCRAFYSLHLLFAATVTATAISNKFIYFFKQGNIAEAVRLTKRILKIGENF